jgi:hypothetical protein
VPLGPARVASLPSPSAPPSPASGRRTRLRRRKTNLSPRSAPLLNFPHPAALRGRDERSAVGIGWCRRSLLPLRTHRRVIRRLGQIVDEWGGLYRSERVLTPQQAEKHSPWCGGIEPHPDANCEWSNTSGCLGGTMSHRLFCGSTRTGTKSRPGRSRRPMPDANPEADGRPALAAVQKHKTRSEGSGRSGINQGKDQFCE